MIEINTYKICSEGLPTSFDGFKIAHLSDFHNKRKNVDIIQKLKEIKPNIIAITGDFIDSRRTKLEISLAFAKEIIEIAPCYYVMGNHESRLTGIYEGFEAELREIGFCVLRNEATEIQINGEKITLVGIDDPRLKSKKESVRGACKIIANELRDVKKEGFSVLLSHRPEAFLEYAYAGIDLALTGHAHGGQIILPLIGGLIAPNQGLFPKYYRGIYERDKTKMIVSRGLGNSLFPFRFNNRPEIIEVVLCKKY